MTNITKLYQQLQEGKTTRDYFVREARRQFPQFISPVSPFNDIVNILKNKRLVSENLTKEASGAFFDAPPAPKDEMEEDLNTEELEEEEEEQLNEAHKLDTEQILDRMSPYAVKKGIEVELKKEKVVDKTTLDIVRARVAKKLKKNNEAYNDLILANVKSIDKQDKDLETKEVKQELVDKKNAMRKPKGFKAEKANTKASKKENKKGKPKGVKVMPDKGVIGTEKVIKESVESEIEKKIRNGEIDPAEVKAAAEKAMKGDSSQLTALMAGLPGITFTQNEEDEKQAVLHNIKEWLHENVYREYHEGMQVKTPKGEGIVKEVRGGTLMIELQNEEKTLEYFQFNQINRAMDAAEEEPPMTTPEEQPAGEMTKAERDAEWAKLKLPKFGSVQGSDTGVPKSLYSDMTYEEKLKAIIEKVQSMEEGEKKQKALEIVKKKLKEDLYKNPKTNAIASGSPNQRGILNKAGFTQQIQNTTGVTVIGGTQ